ncbi:MAG: hypothetical protein AABZ61_05075, partial [Bacteroidota bacterium]
MASAYAQFLHSASKLVPFVLVANDAEQMDEFSLAALRYLVKGLSETRIFILVGVTGDISTALPFEAENTVRLPLEELSLENVAELVRASLGDRVAATEIPQRLYQLYGGIPPLIVEALRVMIEVLPLSAPDDIELLAKSADELEKYLPAKLEDFFAHRCSKLTKEELLLLQVLSCFEQSPSVALLSSIVPMQAQRLNEYLNLLQNEGHILLLENGGRCRIRHARLKNYLYTSTGDAKEKLHSFIASKFTEMAGVDTWEDLEELARQYSLGAELEKASLHYEVAGEQAVKLQELPRAIQLFQQAIDLDRERSGENRQLALNEKLAQAYFASGSYQKSQQVYEEILTRLPASDARQVSIHH